MKASSRALRDHALGAAIAAAFLLCVPEAPAGATPSAGKIAKPLGYSVDTRADLSVLRAGEVARFIATPRTDDYCPLLAARGVRALPVLYAPTLGGEEWREYVAARVAMCPGAAAFEVGNEPNLTAFAKAALDPDRYVVRFREARQAAPSATLLTAGLAPVESPGRDWRPYLRDLERHGVTDAADGVAYHLYPQITGRGIKSSLRLGRRITDGDPAWVTEIAASSINGERQQARMLMRYLWRAARRARLVAIYRIRDGLSAMPYFRHTGLLALDGEPKLVLRKIRRAAT